MLKNVSANWKFNRATFVHFRSLNLLTKLVIFIATIICRKFMVAEDSTWCLDGFRKVL